MRFGRPDPGPCPICGVAHTACTAGATTSVSVAQLPARDAAAAASPASARPPLRAETVQAGLPAGTVTTGTYRGGLKAKGRR
jgi:hypothetical protein